MTALEDHQVDRSEVYARISKGAELTDTSTILTLPKNVRPSRRGNGGVFFQQLIFPGDHSGGVTPVPIPNTDVKPTCADDTREGKVGSCQDFLPKSPRL